jgi:hypothetical protein
MQDISRVEIRIGTWGRIMAGEEAGHYVFVQDDSESTGGFLILTKPDPRGPGGTDSWVEKYDDLPRFFAEAGWVIEWLE